MLFVSSSLQKFQVINGTCALFALFGHLQFGYMAAAKIVEKPNSALATPLADDAWHWEISKCLYSHHSSPCWFRVDENSQGMS